MRCAVNIILPTIRFLPVSKDVLTYLFKACEVDEDVHLTIADGQMNEAKQAWIFRIAEPLLKVGRMTYIGLEDPIERMWRAAQIDTEWVLLLSDDDAPSVNYVRCLCDDARRATPETTAVLPRTFVCYSPSQFYHFRFQPIQEQSQRGRLLSLFKQGQNGLATFGVMRRRLFHDWMKFVRRKPVWATYSDQLFVSFLAMKGRVALTEEECVYLKDESVWHNLQTAFLKDALGYPKSRMALGHEIFLVADLFRFLRANGLEDAALPSLTYRAKELLKSGIVYHPIRLNVLDINDGGYSKTVSSLMMQLVARAMSLADEDLNGHLQLFQEIESSADQLWRMEHELQPVGSQTGSAADPIANRMPEQPQPVSVRKSEGMNRLRLLLVVHGFPPKQIAGTELYTLALARELQRRGHEVRVLYPVLDGTAPDGTVSEDQYEGIAVSQLHVSRPRTFEELFFHQGAAEAFRSYLQRYHADLVHFQHLIGLSASVLGVCKQLNVPSAMTLHDSWLLCEQCHYMLPDGEFCSGPETVDKCVQCMLARYPGSPMHQQIPLVHYQLAQRREVLRAAIQQVNTLIVLTEFQRRNLEQYGFLHPKTVVAPIGLELPQAVAHRPSEGPLRLLYLGHIAKRKGLDVLMRAFSRLPKHKARLDIYGEVLDWKYFEQVMGLVGAVGGVTCHGGYTKADLSRILSQCDIAVVPSRAEFYPTTVRECLAARVPVIASSVGGVPEIIEHGRTGLLFRSGDDADLADKIGQFISDPDQVERFRSRITPVRTIAQDVDQLEQIYGELVGQPVWQEPNAASPHSKSARTTHAVPVDERNGSFDCSIIIPVWNKEDLTKQCLTALSEVTDGVSYEVIVVDNGSTDGTAEFLSSLGGDVRIIRNNENLGFAKACNQGAHMAQGRYLVFLHNDTVPLNGWLQALVSEVETHSEVGIVGSKLLYRDGTVQHAGVSFSRERFIPYHLYRGLPGDLPAVNRRREFQAVTAACMLVRREVFEDVGGFDEGDWNGFEDVDLCLKVRERGWKIIYQPKSVLYHLESQTPGRKAHDADNSRLFLNRWGSYWWLADDDLHYYTDGYKLQLKDTPQGSLWCPHLFEDERERAAWGHVAEAQAAAVKKDWAGVRQELSLVQEWPRDPHVLCWAATVCEKLKEPVRQQSFLERSLQLKETPAVRRSLVRVLLAQKNLAAAEHHLRPLLAAFPEDPEGQLLQGILCMQREQYGEAESAFSVAYQGGADRKKCLMGMGMASLGRAYAQGAWERFLQVMREHPDDAEAIHWLLRAGTAQNRWEDLSGHLRAYLTRNPGDLAVRFALASVLVRADRIEAARKEFETLRMLAPAYDGLAELEQAISRKEAVLAMEAAQS